MSKLDELKQISVETALLSFQTIVCPKMCIVNAKKPAKNCINKGGCKMYQNFKESLTATPFSKDKENGK